MAGAISDDLPLITSSRSESYQRAALLSGAAGGRGRMPVKLTRVDKINAKTHADKQSCFITDLDVTADGNILLADSYNSKIKLFSPSGHLLSSLKLDNEPRSVTVIDKTEAAVSMSESRMIKKIILTDSRHICVKHSIEMQDGVAQIRGYNNKMVILSYDWKTCSDWNTGFSVQMIGDNGKVIWAKSKDRYDNKLFDGDLHLAIQRRKAGDHVIVTDYCSRRITVLSAETGEVVKVRVAKKRLSGVTVDSSNRIYVSYVQTGEISVWSADLVEERCLISEESQWFPQAVAYDRISGELFVANQTGNSIHRFRIVQSRHGW